MTVVDLVFEVHRHFADGAIDHAFGGALALAYYSEPRGTIDVDVNVFVPFADAPSVVDQLGALGLAAELPPKEWMPDAGVRLVHPNLPALDLFFSINDHYREIAARTRWFPFGSGGDELPFLSAEDLVVFKLSFGRDKDWVDLRRVIRASPDLDLAYIERQLLGLRGPSMHPRLARLRMMARPGPPGDP